ncbi:MAG: response regulator [Pseudomonadota bacterium]
MTSPPKKILVVDDVFIIRNMVCNTLKKAGYNVELTENGADAFLRATSTNPPFDLIISDISMPRLDGYGLLKKLRKTEYTKSIPVIFLTSDGQKESVIKALQGGGNDYIVKPYKPDLLLKKVSNQIEKCLAQPKL